MHPSPAVSGEADERDDHIVPKVDSRRPAHEERRSVDAVIYEEAVEQLADRLCAAGRHDGQVGDVREMGDVPDASQGISRHTRCVVCFMHADNHCMFM